MWGGCAVGACAPAHVNVGAEGLESVGLGTGECADMGSRGAGLAVSPGLGQGRVGPCGEVISVWAGRAQPCGHRCIWGEEGAGVRRILGPGAQSRS